MDDINSKEDITSKENINSDFRFDCHKIIATNYLPQIICHKLIATKSAIEILEVLEWQLFSSLVFMCKRLAPLNFMLNTWSF